MPASRSPASNYFHSPVFLRYAIVILMLTTLPVLFLSLEKAEEMGVGWWPLELPEPVLKVLHDCAGAFYAGVFPGLLILLAMVFGHPQLDRSECLLLCLIALFLGGGSFAVLYHLRS